MYIKKIEIENIRCFKEFSLDFSKEDDFIPWTLFVGDNAVGKTALLKAIAIGLCDQSSAAGLLRESDEGYIRRGDISSGKISITLINPESKTEYSIVTMIEKVPYSSTIGSYKGVYERVTQDTFPTPYPNFPWGDIFACGYGAARGIIGTGDISGYSVINSVYDLFNYSEGLQNPELTIRRIASQSKESEVNVLKLLSKVLFGHLGSERNYAIEISPDGLVADGPWGEKMPLRDLADGYKSTMLWLTNFIGWAISHNYSITDPSDIIGIVLIDEIEQHLHPKWQKTIIRSLREEFPKVQFIATTHSPLVASTIGSFERDHPAERLVHLSLQKANEAVKYIFEDTLKGYDIDQVLGSKAFDFQSKEDEDVAKLFRVASELASKGADRDATENEQYARIKEKIKTAIPPDGSTLIEQELAKEVFNDMRVEIELLEKKLFGTE